MKFGNFSGGQNISKTEIKTLILLASDFHMKLCEKNNVMSRYQKNNND